VSPPATPPTAPAISAAARAAVAGFQVPETLGFGAVMLPVMYRCEYAAGAWSEGCVEPYTASSLDPAAKTLHYAQCIFEGLKAYRVEHDRSQLFRPYMNARRLNRSAARMLMPSLPEAQFVGALAALAACAEPVMPRRAGEALYLRPVMFGTEAALGLGPSATYSFLVIASLVETVAPRPLRVMIEREGTRAGPGGTGDVKVAGNYGASLHATRRAMDEGFDQPLWLDAASHRFIEELSIMNFFAVIDGALATPALSGTILPGVTRDSVIALARADGMSVREAPLAVEELLEAIRGGRCTEAFACGTAAVLAPIALIGERGGERYELAAAPGPVATRLRRELLAIQEGRAPDRFDWLQPVPAAC